MTAYSARLARVHLRDSGAFRDGSICASRTAMHGVEKRIVYIVRSGSEPSHHYTGITNDIPGRLEWHNHGPAGHTVRYRPWSLVGSMEFPTEHAAVRFERYLKSGSGRAFAKRHFGEPGDDVD